jgi:hypothetical protein
MYSGIDGDGNVYTLEITENTSRAYAPQGGDSYVLTIYVGTEVKTSTGTVSPTSTSTNLVLEHKDSGSVAIIVTAAGGIDDILGDIPIDEESPYTKPLSINPPPVTPAELQGTWLFAGEEADVTYSVAGNSLTLSITRNGDSVTGVAKTLITTVTGPTANVDEDTKADYPHAYTYTARVITVHNDEFFLDSPPGSAVTVVWNLNAENTEFVQIEAHGLEHYVKQ